MARRFFLSFCPEVVIVALRVLGSRVAAVETRRIVPPPKRVDAELATAEHRRWAHAVCERAGWRCEHVDDHGRRCERSRARGDRMHADHVVERADGGALVDPDNGQCLCTQHNTSKGLAARAARVRG